jgi:hypothetical protein
MNMTRNVIALALAFALVFTLRTIAAAEEDDPPPKPVQFRPWQQAWQCNDVRITVTESEPGHIDYDVAGTLWFGSRFSWVRLVLYFNGRPCLPLQPVRLP